MSREWVIPLNCGSKMHLLDSEAFSNGEFVLSQCGKSFHIGLDKLLQGYPEEWFRSI